MLSKEELESHILSVPDFPKKGVVFKDISPLLSEKLPELIETMAKNIKWDGIDAIVGIESRGFILGAAMAAKIVVGFIPMRKKGKLPPPVIAEDYILEYGTDSLELKINEQAKNIVLVDDVLATGGTLKAALLLCQKNNYNVKAVSLLINLKFLNELSQELDYIHSVLDYE